MWSREIKYFAFVIPKMTYLMNDFQLVFIKLTYSPHALTYLVDPKMIF